MSIAEPQVDFVEDGHTVTVVWDRDNIRISDVECPHAGMTSLCNRKRMYCVVQRFVETFGFDLNIGRTVVKSPVEIAWVPVPGECDLDSEFSALWVVPVDDPEFRSMKADRGESAS